MNIQHELCTKQMHGRHTLKISKNLRLKETWSAKKRVNLQRFLSRWNSQAAMNSGGTVAASCERRRLRWFFWWTRFILLMFLHFPFVFFFLFFPEFSLLPSAFFLQLWSFLCFPFRHHYMLPLFSSFPKLSDGTLSSRFFLAFSCPSVFPLRFSAVTHTSLPLSVFFFLVFLGSLPSARKLPNPPELPLYFFFSRASLSVLLLLWRRCSLFFSFFPSLP